MYNLPGKGVKMQLMRFTLRCHVWSHKKMTANELWKLAVKTPNAWEIWLFLKHKFVSLQRDIAERSPHIAQAMINHKNMQMIEGFTLSVM